MKILTLIIKQKFFDEIMSGKKKIETREVSKANAKKLVQVDESGFLVENPTSETSPYYPKKYDAIRFYVGYKPDRDTALVKVLNVENEAIKTDDGRFIFDGDPKNDDFFVFSVNNYELGEIIEKTHTHRAK